MDTCFLFTEYLNEAGCLCLKLNAEGAVLSPPAQLEFKDIKKLQENSTTILVESSSQVTLITLELPWLADRKARSAIPYALEDKLAQPVEELHFAFDKQHYHNNHYLITVIAKHRMHYLMQLMDDNNIDFEMITVDWFALDEEELCVCGPHLLINQTDFKGALSGSLALTYAKLHTLTPPLLFSDSQLEINKETVDNAESSYMWIARKLVHKNPLNLCQGSMQHGTASDWIKKGYTLAALSAVVWLISLLIVNGITLYSLNKKTAHIDQQIEGIYHQFFPEAKQVISPKFRISQLLKANQDEGQTRFWFLINEFAKTMKNSTITIEQMRYQSKTLLVTVVSPDFATLQKFENALKQQLKVNQTQASTHEQQVMATLELS
ncbi:type II secretion system protein GspL [Legionella sp. km772]|uniref:type II secretion system protein GspL n=1 Tax=Legionella sp. km772 TaxID=2498111 RepID=UPI000F8DCC3E|nr:type II secretion system protein GspL [Legionella sp. km772]RUR10291.1 general secretion pathway protein GspL [Legionella sp. km772]